VIDYNVGLRPFAVTGTCLLEDASSVVVDGYRIITATVSFKERGLLTVEADSRQLGLFRSTDVPPVPISITKPVDVPANPPPGSSLWIDSRSGAGGIFRVRIDPALGMPQSLALGFEKCVVTINPVARTMRVENAFEGDVVEPTATVPIGSTGTLQTNYCMVDPARSRLALPVMDLAIFFPAEDPGRSKAIRLTAVPAGGGAPVVTAMGTYLSTTTAIRPVVTFHDGLLKFVFRAEVPIQQASVVIGRDNRASCRIVFDRSEGLRVSPVIPGVTACSLDRERSSASIAGNDLVFVLAHSPLSGVNHIFTNFTPEGFSATGWFNTYLNYLIAFNVAATFIVSPA